MRRVLFYNKKLLSLKNPITSLAAAAAAAAAAIRLFQCLGAECTLEATNACACSELLPSPIIIDCIRNRIYSPNFPYSELYFRTTVLKIWILWGTKAQGPSSPCSFTRGMTGGGTALELTAQLWHLVL
jgi:hypothetical protein